MKNTKKTKNDIILVAVILLVAAAGLLFVSLTREVGNYAVIKIDGVSTSSYPLNENTTVEILTGENNDFTNTLVIENGKAYVSEANCPDKICAGHKAVSYSGETIVCLPHKIVIEIVSTDNTPSLDAIA
mgnify:CR=1 FL=1